MSAQRRVYLHCHICGDRTPLEDLTFAEYTGPRHRSAGGGIVCPQCLDALPAIVVVNSEVWRLLMHAP